MTPPEPPKNGSLLKALFNAVVFVLPFLIALNVWFVSTIYEMQTAITAFSAVGPRYTPDMARSDNLQLKHDVMEEIEARYPPEWLRREVESHARRLEALERNGHGQIFFPYEWELVEE
jgi:hypothetical protein